MNKCDINVYTQWMDCEGNVVFESGDKVKVTLETNEVLIGEIEDLDGETMTLSTKILGDIDIDMCDMKEITRID